MAKSGPRLQITRQDGITVIELLDQEILEEGSIADIQESLFAVVEETPRINVLLSFIHVKHLSSSALGTLIRLNKRVEENGGRLILCEIKPALYEIFVITKLNRLFAIFEDRDEALESFE